MSIAGVIQQLNNELPPAVKLVAVSKYKPVGSIMEAYEAGQRAFGENRPQELAAKAVALPDDIQWHFIGHLQTNKLKMVIPYASLIHSIDSLKLLEAVDRAAGTLGRKVDCLLEVHIAAEQSKQGFTPDEVRALAERFEDYSAIRFRGVMGMASHTDDMEQVRMEFRSLAALAAEIRTAHTGFDQISMGMSGDWRIAVEEGATIIRIGTAIFGSRI